MIVAENEAERREGAGQAAAAPARGLRTASSRRWRAARSRSALLDPAAARVPAARRGRACAELAERDGQDASRRSTRRIEELHESNPMLGHRGCRLGIVYPGDHRDAGARHLRGGLRRAEEGHRRSTRSHDPAGRLHEGARTCRTTIVRETADEGLRREAARRSSYLVGTMIEVPRAALTRRPDRRDGRVLLLRHQRPDADHASACRATTCRAFIGVLPASTTSISVDPFAAIDRDGVGALMKIAVDRRPRRRSRS